jgi:hypothetical protein
MPYQATWYAHKRVMLLRLLGNVTLDDAAEAHRCIVQFLNEGRPLVHILTDLSEVEQFPTNLAALQHAMPPIDNSDLGWMLIYGAGNPMLRFVTSTITQLMMPGSRYRMLNTLDESLTFLKGQDTTLGNLMSASSRA